MNSAPMIVPLTVPAPPISTMAMNCTDSSRLKLLGLEEPDDRVDQRAGAAGVERGDRERQRLGAGPG